LQFHAFTSEGPERKQQHGFEGIGAVLVCLAVVAITFQIIFCAKIHINDFFYFLKIIFDISTSK